MSTYRYNRSKFNSGKLPRRDNHAVWSYLAGIIDGEGTINITYSPKNEERNVRVQVGNTSSSLISYLKNTFGGSVGKGQKTKGNKLFKVWVISGNRLCKLFLIRLKPYLIIKDKQAETALRFIDSFRADRLRYKTRKGFARVNVGKHHELWSEREKLREELYIKNKVLNQGEIYV